ncbi:MAG TPA: hypothetical protein VGO47_10365 [Chlamydiales bacterium]|jgi:hypothetical protein|nr:hypothetical protein [Chlamydiales bacterium]
MTDTPVSKNSALTRAQPSTPPEASSQPNSKGKVGLIEKIALSVLCGSAAWAFIGTAASLTMSVVQQVSLVQVLTLGTLGITGGIAAVWGIPLLLFLLTVVVLCLKTSKPQEVSPQSPLAAASAHPQPPPAQPQGASPQSPLAADSSARPQTPSAKPAVKPTTHLVKKATHGTRNEILLGINVVAPLDPHKIRRGITLSKDSQTVYAEDGINVLAKLDENGRCKLMAGCVDGRVEVDQEIDAHGDITIVRKIYENVGPEKFLISTSRRSHKSMLEENLVEPSVESFVRYIRNSPLLRKQASQFSQFFNTLKEILHMVVICRLLGIQDTHQRRIASTDASCQHVIDGNEDLAIHGIRDPNKWIKRLEEASRRNN